MRIAIVGANGRLGQALLRAFDGHHTIPWTRQDFDIQDHRRAAGAIISMRPHVVINTAAFHHTDACEDDPEKAFSVNAVAVRNIAQACHACGAVLVQVSTDYVFDGQKGEPYEETDPPNPINVYGVSKLAGECFVRSVCERYYIIRTASLFGHAEGTRKRSFVEMVLDRAQRNEPIVVVSDVVMSPTYTEDAASMIRRLIEGGAPYGVYHLTNTGSCSWYAFAKAILELAKAQASLTPTNIQALAPKAARPAFSALISRAILSA
ncbi:MAG: dTDP-4-dehydrorhamnose reductase, partial [Armatimonadota bacterium]|nr:dTDP-4-dehydrorhamnose reductase [Armatimonadota bacterium]